MSTKRKTDFAMMLKAWRERKQFTQPQAAAELGISVDSIQNWEIRRYVPNGTIRKLLTQKLSE